MSKPWPLVDFKTVVKSRGSGSSSLPKKEWLANGAFPVIGQGEGDVEGWTDREDLLVAVERPLILYGGHTKRTKIVREPFVAGPNVKILTPSRKLLPEFLRFHLLNADVEDRGYADHFPLVRKIPIPLPPLEEQKRIAAVLDEAFAAIDAAAACGRRNVTNARELFESEINLLFDVAGSGDEHTHLEKVAEIQSGFAFKSREYQEDGHFLVR